MRVHRVQKVPGMAWGADGLPRIGATPELQAEFRARTNRLLAIADALPRGEESESAGISRPPLPVHAPPVRAARKLASPIPRFQRAAANRSVTSASRPEPAMHFTRPRLFASPAAETPTDVRLQSGDDLATALGCCPLAGESRATVLVRTVRTRVPAVLEWVRALPACSLPASREAGDSSRPRRAGTLFLDIETAGLANAPILLVGCAWVVGRRIVVRQYLAVDYPSEEAMLRAVAREVQRATRIVTFNGASFDLPSLRDRTTLWGLPPLRIPAHTDLLPLARRAWRGYVANCRLGTLEAVILGRPRRQDLPSREVPEQFHRFVRTADPSVVAPILQHNAVDVVSMAGLAVALGVPV